MGERDVVILEVGAALSILSLLLVFLPLFLQRLDQASGGRDPLAKQAYFKVQGWGAVLLMVLAAADATAGLFTIWGEVRWEGLTGWLLVALVWLVVGLAVWAAI